MACHDISLWSWPENWWLMIALSTIPYADTSHKFWRIRDLGQALPEYNAWRLESLELTRSALKRQGLEGLTVFLVLIPNTFLTRPFKCCLTLVSQAITGCEVVGIMTCVSRIADSSIMTRFWMAADSVLRPTQGTSICTWLANSLWLCLESQAMTRGLLEVGCILFTGKPSCNFLSNSKGLNLSAFT